MAIEENIIDGLMADIVGVSSSDTVEKDSLQTTIQNILHDYNLSTDLSFVEKIAAINFGKTEQGKNDKESIGDVPQELKDAAFLPVNTIADIALKQDIDTVITQIPEWYTAIQVMRDTICETDIVTGRLARNITFDETKVSDDEHEKGTIIGKIEECEERLELHQLIKNHMVTGTIEYGEDAMFNVNLDSNEMILDERIDEFVKGLKINYNQFYRGIVVDNHDPEKLGRVRVRIPQIYGADKTTQYFVPTSSIPWATCAISPAGNDSGTYLPPNIGDTVFVTYEAGDREHPMYFGGIYTIRKEDDERLREEEEHYAFWLWKMFHQRD